MLNQKDIYRANRSPCNKRPIDFNYRSARNLHQQLQESGRVAAWACTTGSGLNRHLQHPKIQQPFGLSKVLLAALKHRKNAFNRVVAPVPRLPVGAGGPVPISRHQASRIAISGALPLDPCGCIGASDRRSGGFLLRQCSRSTCTSIGGAGFPVSVRVKAVRVLPRLSGIEWHGQLIAGIPASNFVTVIGLVSGFYRKGWRYAWWVPAVGA